MKAYEGLFIFPSALKEDALEKCLERIRGEMTKLEGTVANTEVLGSRTFSRPLKKKENGTYVRITFSMKAEALVALQARLKLIEDIFRVQITQAEQGKAA